MVRGTSVRHAAGPESSLRGLDWHPVVHVTYEDAAAYAAWAGKTLPTEAEWERSALAVRVRERDGEGQHTRDGCVAAGLHRSATKTGLSIGRLRAR
jgi:formylglycine-generating enzyme required for sulfatase activity